MHKFIFRTLTVAVLSVCSISFAENNSKKERVVNQIPIEIKISTSDSESSARYATLKKFKDELTQNLGYKVNVVLINPLSAYKEGEELEALSFDLVNIIIPSSTSVGYKYNYKELYLYDLPYLFDKPEDILEFSRSSLAKEMLSKLESREYILKPLAFSPGYYRSFISKFPLNNLNNFKNKSARVDFNDGLNNIYFSSLGVSDFKNQTMQQMQTSLNKDSVNSPDIIELDLNTINDEKLFKYYKYLTISEHNVTNYIILTNKRWFNKLPENIQQSIQEVSKNVSEYNFNYLKNRNLSDIEDLKNNGVKISYLNDKEKSMLVNKAIPVHESYLKNINSQYLKQVYSAVR